MGSLDIAVHRGQPAGAEQGLRMHPATGGADRGGQYTGASWLQLP